MTSTLRLAGRPGDLLAPKIHVLMPTGALPRARPYSSPNAQCVKAQLHVPPIASVTMCSHLGCSHRSNSNPEASHSATPMIWNDGTFGCFELPKLVEPVSSTQTGTGKTRAVVALLQHPGCPAVSARSS